MTTNSVFPPTKNLPKNPYLSPKNLLKQTSLRTVSENRVFDYQGVGSAAITPAVCVRNITDYSPFGVSLDGRTFESDGYRYGFQNQERDDELKGKGNSMNFEYRMHDPRVGRFFAIDPLAPKYPWYTPYQFSGNKVIYAIELEGLEEYVLTNNVDENGKVISSSFKYDESAKKLKNHQDIWVNSIDPNGNITTVFMNVKDAVYKGGQLNPTPAPERIIGTKHYYWWRNNDFKIRHELMASGEKAPDYYLGYGDKYARRFKDETRKILSAKGKKWLDKTLIYLQNSIEVKLQSTEGYKIETQNDKFRVFAFGTHPEAYEDAGLFDLPASDLWKIGNTPDYKDTFFSTEGWKQILKIGSDYHHEVLNDGEGFADTTF